MVNGIMNSGLAAVQLSQQQAAGAADRIAKSGTTASLNDATSDLLQGTLQLKQAEQMTQAGAKLLNTADDMLGNLLDVMA